MSNTTDWQELQTKIREWREGKNITLSGTINHIDEEVAHLKADPYNILHMADIFILMISVTDLATFSMEEVVEAIKAKIAINGSREWAEPDAEGIVRHKDLTPDLTSGMLDLAARRK